jgi:Transport and Golgi organisation 2
VCTASWLTSADGFELFFNRDERRSRPASLPPRQYRTPGGRRYLAPLDAEAGGSWIAVNEAGLAVCLLNRYAASPEKREEPLPAQARSRGEIVLQLVDADSLASARQRLLESPLARYRPFTALLLQAGQPATSIAWNDQSLVIVELVGHEPLSSSAAAPAALANRAAVWRALGEAGRSGRDRHLEFHRSHWPHPSALSVCMHRPEAETESFCHLQVQRRSVVLAWAPGPLCAGGATVEIALALLPALNEEPTAAGARRPETPA